MVQNKVALLLVAVLAFCAVTIASPLVKRDASSSEESGELAEITKELQELCRNNSGSDEAFMKLMESGRETFVCFIGAFDFESFVQEVDTLTNETRTTFFPRYCPQLQDAYRCTNKLLNDFRPCLEEDDFTIVEALAGLLPDAVELICKNDGEILFKLDEPQYSDCIDKVGDSLNECVTKYLNGTDDWDLSHMNQEQCSDLSGFRECVKGKLNICKAPELISVYDLFHNTLFRMTPCRNFVELQKPTETAVTDIVNNDLNEN